MSRRLPPLTWLRAFEAAGRLESFRAAAEELHLTPSAVSHHVRSLERHVERPLFQRTGNGVRLTAEGRAYLGRLSAGFEQLALAGDVIGGPAAPARLTIGAFPFLVSEVLLPRLAELRARLPGLEISVVSGTSLALLSHADPAQRADALVRYGTGRFPACRSRKLTDVFLVPVAAPALVAHRDDGGLPAAPRIVVAGPFDGWRSWAETTGCALDAGGETVTFDNYLSAMRAAEQGLGVGLGIRPFIDPWLAAGRVVALPAPVAPVDQASYLVTAPHAADTPRLEVLAEWLTACLGRG